MNNLTFNDFLNADFKLYDGNPVIKNPLSSFVIADPSVLTPDVAHDGLWHLFCHTFFGVYMYDSVDGINFVKKCRVVKHAMRPNINYVDGKYYLSWVVHTERGTSIGIAITEDFVTWDRKENAVLPVSRNGVLFPRKVNGEYMLFSRPCDKGHTPYGDIFLSHSPDLTYWGKHRFVIKPEMVWESTKVGAGPTPIETDEGWLCFYHGVLTSCNGFTYSMGAMIVDKDEPWKVLHRADCYLLSPRETYEFVGDVPNVCFPCAALADSETGKIAIYYGGADTVVGLAFTTVDETINFIKEHDLIK